MHKGSPEYLQGWIQMAQFYDEVWNLLHNNFGTREEAILYAVCQLFRCYHQVSSDFIVLDEEFWNHNINQNFFMNIGEEEDKKEEIIVIKKGQKQD